MSDAAHHVLDQATAAVRAASLETFRRWSLAAQPDQEPPTIGRPSENRDVEATLADSVPQN